MIRAQRTDNHVKTTRCIIGSVVSLLTFVPLSVAGGTMNEDIVAVNDLFAQGFFEQAKEEYETLLESSPHNPQIIERLGFIYYFSGEYQKGIEHFKKVIELDPSKTKFMSAFSAFAYYLMRDYSSAVNILEEAEISKVNLLNQAQLRHLAKQPVYQIEAEVDRTVIPFKRLDPLPIVQIEVDSKRIFVLLDTGAAQLVLDSAFAQEQGIEPLGIQDVKGAAGGKTARSVGFGEVESVKLGEVTIRNVPVCLLQTRAWSKDFGEEINGVLGTEILMQFLPTIDFLDKKIVLRIRNDKNIEEVANMKAKARVPFVIIGTHAMYAQCCINKRGPVLMYFDSGMADDQGASLKLKGAALTDLNIEQPKTDREGYGAGGPAKFGYVDIAEIKVGDLVRKKQKAVYEGREGRLLSVCGYKSYGIISHNFLNHYRWTIDFDNRLFLFDY